MTLEELNNRSLSELVEEVDRLNDKKVQAAIRTRDSARFFEDREREEKIAAQELYAVMTELRKRAANLAKGT